MNNEQSCYIEIYIKSQALATILMNYGDLFRKVGDFTEVSFSQVTIKATDNFTYTNVPKSNKDIVPILSGILKDNIGKESKPIIKEVKKAKNAIIEDAVCDWSYTETCIGELAKDMSQIHKDVPDLEEAGRVEKYIYEFTLKNGEYKEKEYAVYK